MLTAIVRFALRRRVMVLALAAILFLTGLFFLQRAKYDVFPNFAPPMVAIQTSAPGLAPRQVERLVTTPIEVRIVGLPGIKTVFSKSIQGLSVVKITFNDSTNIYRARQLVAERLGMVRLPQGVRAPLMTPLVSATGTAMDIGLTSRRLTPMQLRTLADWPLRLQLLAARGVANALIFGGAVEEYQIQFHPRDLIRYHLGLSQVMAAARRATALRGAGFINTASQRLVLETRGQPSARAELAGVVVARVQGFNVTLGQVAAIRRAAAPRLSAATIEGRPGVIISVKTQYGANTLQVTRNVQAALRAIAPTLRKKGVRLHILFKPATFIHVALRHLGEVLLWGGVLVIVVLFLFLFDLRTAAISFIAIPLSLLAAVLVLTRLGDSLNIMSLGGLAIAIGEVVDDAVIDVENIARRLRQNRLAPAAPRPAIRVVLEASVEVRSAVVYATFAVVLIFLPILGLTGVAGSLFRPLALAYIFSILASLGVALTVTPALGYLLLARRGDQNPIQAENGTTLDTAQPPLVRLLTRAYRPCLEFVERFYAWVMAAVAAMTVAGVLLLLSFHSSFLPNFKEGHFILHVHAAPGTSLAESQRIGDHITKALRPIPEIRSLSERIGHATAGEARGPEGAEIGIDLKPHLSGPANLAAARAIRRTLKPFLGLSFQLNTFLVERMSETMSGFTSPIAINVFGPRLTAVNRVAGEVARAVKKIPGASGVRIRAPQGEPHIHIHLRPRAIARWGLDPVTVLQAVTTAFRGVVAGQIYHGEEVFNLRVILPPRRRHEGGLRALRRLPVLALGGNYVRLAQLARMREVSGPQTILHLGGRRAQSVTTGFHGVSLGRFVSRLYAAMAKIKLPPGVYLQYAGAGAAASRSLRQLLLYSGLALAGIILLLSVVMGNGRNLLLVLVNLPFALMGGVLAVWFLGGRLSLGPLVGFITLFGITIRNSMMLISHFEHLVDQEGMNWGPAAALRGASERLAPILMTATITGLGLLPLALRRGAPGLEIEGPMAVVILGGLISSTVLNLLVLPALALRFGRFTPQAATGLE